MNNATNPAKSHTVHSRDGLAITLSPAYDARIQYVQATVAYVRSEKARKELVAELRAFGVVAAPTYVRVA